MNTPAAPPHSSSLNARRRERELDALTATAGREPVDLLVIGGGVTGAGVALDAAARGLSVVLAEKHDLAFGTSRWSSKLVHGGLRYLAAGSVGIARESARERGILIERTAGHLVRPLPQLLPLLPPVRRAGAAFARSGLLAGDVLRMSSKTSHQTLPFSRKVTRAEVARLAPSVAQAGLRGGLVGWDGQLTDDARLVVGLARTAAAYGARILTRCAAEQVTGHGAVLRDTRSGHASPVEARMVINAAGVWAGDLAPGVHLRPSRGSHLVFDQAAFAGLGSGLLIPVPGSRSRFVFALPVPGDRVYVGLTDEDTGGEIPDVPRASEAEVDYLLDTVNTVLHAPLGRADVRATFSGLRPLLDTGGGASADVSRRHAVLTSNDGLVTVVGGKLTTYRRMAEDAVDAALGHSGRSAEPCRTHALPLVGAGGRAELAGLDAPTRLIRRYGTEAPAVLGEAGGDPRLLEPLDEGIDTCRAELLFAVRHEGALDEEDLLHRRTRVGLIEADAERGLSAASEALGEVYAR